MTFPAVDPSRIPNRSFGGCDTCRARHVKCDEAIPTCEMCALSGVLCKGYQKSLFFNLDVNASNESGRFRRAVLTEAERERMSRGLVASVPPRSALKWIRQLEDEGGNASESENLAITRGPFGVFRFVPEPHSPPPPSDHAEDVNLMPELEPLDAGDAFTLFSGDPHSHWAQDMMEVVAGQARPTPTQDSPESNSNEATLNLQEDSLVPGIEEIIAGQIPTPSFPPIQDPLDYRSLEDPRISSLASMLGVRNTSPREAPFLLKHYFSNVLSFYTPFRDSKTPWQVLFISQAKTCLAALSIGECPDHASLCIFYGILAISALSLGHILGSSEWLQGQSKLYKERELEHYRYMLSMAYMTPKAAKYKVILMAFIIMIQYAMTSGHRDKAKVYFLEAEKFIRSKGLSGKKSRKVRMLHHCYALERILYETTALCDPCSSERLRVRMVVESSGLVIYRQDCPTFHLPRWQDLQREMSGVHWENDNDLLFEQPGIFFETLYPEIFGIPEPFVLLMSLIVRLGREKDAAESGSTSSPLDLAGFLGWVKFIEKGIAGLDSLDIVKATGRNQSEVDNNQLASLLKALQSAIIIYFYRRIYGHATPDLHRRIGLVRDTLLRSESDGSKTPFGAVLLIWPAFIAASEVEDFETQASFSMWFEELARQSGLQFFTQALRRLRRIWNIKKSFNGKGLKWMHLMEQAAS